MKGCASTASLSAAPDSNEWTGGNFQVMTSDGVYFRVDDYVLYWAR